MTEALIDRQLGAYNARDLDAFTATYAPDVRILDAMGEVRMEGRDALRAGYGPLFADNPELCARRVARLVVGPWVVDHEEITGGPRPGVLTALVAYRVEDELIAEVRMMWP